MHFTLTIFKLGHCIVRIFSLVCCKSRAQCRWQYGISLSSDRYWSVIYLPIFYTDVYCLRILKICNRREELTVRRASRVDPMESPLVNSLHVVVLTMQVHRVSNKIFIVTGWTAVYSIRVTRSNGQVTTTPWFRPRDRGNPSRRVASATGGCRTVVGGHVVRAFKSPKPSAPITNGNRTVDRLFVRYRTPFYHSVADAKSEKRTRSASPQVVHETVARTDNATVAYARP